MKRTRGAITQKGAYQLTEVLVFRCIQRIVWAEYYKLWNVASIDYGWLFIVNMERRLNISGNYFLNIINFVMFY